MSAAILLCFRMDADSTSALAAGVAQRYHQCSGVLLGGQYSVRSTHTAHEQHVDTDLVFSVCVVLSAVIAVLIAAVVSPGVALAAIERWNASRGGAVYTSEVVLVHVISTLRVARLDQRGGLSHSTLVQLSIGR